jgi:Methane oxygenase PmoA
VTTAPDGLSVIHDSDRSLSIGWKAGQLARYVYRPDDPQLESPRPYFHPVKSLRGNVVTVYRPHERPWHKGISLTFATVSGHDFWGGLTYIAGTGYVQLPNNGSTVHHRFGNIRESFETVEVTEELTWLSQAGTELMSEQRRLGFEVVESVGAWRLNFATDLENVSGGPLEFGSPTTLGGPPGGGYGGLFWRGPRSFDGGLVLTPHQEGGEELGGLRVPWMAFVGKHDEVDDVSTLLFVDHAQNFSYPSEWFVRSAQYPGLGPAPFYQYVHTVPAEERLSLRYDIFVADHALSRGECVDLAATTERQLA